MGKKDKTEKVKDTIRDIKEKCLLTINFYPGKSKKDKDEKDMHESSFILPEARNFSWDNVDVISVFIGGGESFFG